MISGKKIKDFKFRFKIIFVCYLISFAFVIPVYYLESSSPDGNITTYQDALFFWFGTLSTIGYGNLTANNPVSQLLIVIAFLLTRGAVFVTIGIATYKVMGNRTKESLSAEDRMLGIENELKNFRSVIMDCQRDHNVELKRARERRMKSGTINISSVASLRDIVRSPVSSKMALVCDFLLDDIYCENADLWSSLKHEAVENGVYSISFNGGVGVVL
ncbi:ion channel [Photobacterium kishitanii]|uniref:Potassium channel domain-containing protein n=1 Tax=Photobacterium kishitanii TaxID=318456 RepID=A0A2T3KM44_9GAMM|nr:ion channel [Photobacterium kishitanii]PSV00877.1 hypothetical protein C9J27_02290 [Photobacterium kishitanii]